MCEKKNKTFETFEWRQIHDAVKKLYFLESYSSKNPKDWRATLGEHKLADKETFEQVRGISSITIHPKYSFPYLQGIFDAPPDYDIGKL